MLSSLCFLFSISSGSAFASVFYKREYEDVLPLTLSGIVLLLLGGALLGHLNTAFMLTLGATILLWIIALLTAARKKDFINAFQPFFSYGFWSFLFIYAGLNYILFGLKLHEWDEFSHWGTVVKAMVQTGSLGTSSQAHLSFGSYPPGMALVQYYLQRLCTLTKTDAFSEWHLYLAYIVAALSFLLPLIKRTGCRSLGSRTIITVIFLILPLPFYKNFYHSLYVDAFLGVLAGAGLAMAVLAVNKRERWYTLYIMSICAMLTLTKFSGVLLSVMVAFAYIIEGFAESGCKKGVLTYAGMVFLSIVIPNHVWNLHIKHFGLSSTPSGTVHLSDIWNILSGKDTTYRSEAFDLFKTALFNNTKTAGNTNFVIGDMGLFISYFSLLVLFFMIFILVWHYMKRKSDTIAKSVVITSIVSLIGWICFYIGLGITYLFKFSEEEALRLASYARYSHAVYLALYILTVSISLKAVFCRFSEKIAAVITFCIILLCTPMEDMAKLLFRDIVRESIDNRAPYLELSEKIRSVAEEGDYVYLICQDERHWFSGAAYWEISFEVRPAVIDNKDSGWMMAKENTNWFISGATAEEWRQTLRNNYDYVALYLLDDYFINTFSELFSESTKIEENNVYRIDKETGMLELCE